MTKPNDACSALASDAVVSAVEAALSTLPGATQLKNILHLFESGNLDRHILDQHLLMWMLQVPELKQQIDSLPAPCANLVNQLVAGSPLATDNTTLPENPVTGSVRAALKAAIGTCPEIVEGNGNPMACVPQAPFQNWGRTVQNTPAVTYLPQTVTGICNLVTWATTNNKRVRVAGYRHTWGQFYSDDDQVLISLLPLDVVNDLPAQEPGIDPQDELQGITIVGTIVEAGVTKALCRIGAATTNEQFRRWCLSNTGGNWQWTLPLNVIMVEITFGGSNAPICHGAGWRNQTLSDLVAEIEFVNPLGVVQKVNDPEQLKAAAGCFGLLGIVTAITLKLDPMTFAAMRPSKQRVALAVPPPAGYPVPWQVDMSGITQQDLAQAQQDFITRCENDYYSEWFWFPFQSQCWINTWNNNGVRSDAHDYPPPVEVLLQWLEEWIAECINNWSLFQDLPGIVQGWLLGFFAMVQMPNIPATDPPITAPLIDALHFRRGIQNMRVLDMEIEIPIPPRADDPTKPDWSLCQRAWWDAITQVYQRLDGPMRIALEMRIMGSSGVTMAPQYGNQFGTCSIEVLTNLNVSNEDWRSFMQQVANAWTAYTDPSGNPLNIRPHWAKQWQGLTFGGVPVVDYLKTVAYKDRIPEFRAGLHMVAAAGGYTLDDLQRMFSNPLLNNLFAEVFSTAGTDA